MHRLYNLCCLCIHNIRTLVSNIRFIFTSFQHLETEKRASLFARVHSIEEVWKYRNVLLVPEQAI